MQPQFAAVALYSMLKVVLDTNVLLDIFVFKNPSVLDIWDLRKDEYLDFYHSSETLNEFINLLSDKKFSFTTEEQKFVLEDYLSKSKKIQPDKPFPLKCKDPDDQMFLELALSIVPSYLVTRDKALLKLRKRSQKEGFSILTPECFLNICKTVKEG